MNAAQQYLLDSVGFVVAKAAIPSNLINKLIPHVGRITAPSKFAYADSDPIFKELLCHHWIINSCRNAIGPHFRLDHAFGIKQTRGKGENLHGGPFCCQGSCYYFNHDGHIQCGRVTIGIVLTKQTRETGGFCYIPGSHKSGSSLGGSKVLQFTGFENTVVPDLEPGDIYFFPDCLVHGCTPWRENNSRIALYAGYCPAHMNWARNHLPFTPQTTLEKSLLTDAFVSTLTPDFINNWRSEVPHDSAFQICRIIGNELPPRDTPGSKLKSLEFICLQNESNRRRYWVLNRLVDPAYRMKVIDILKSNNQEYYEIPFEIKHYLQTADRMHYITNINNARNYGLSLATSEYVACLDQDCFILEYDYHNIVRNIDKKKLDYYALDMRRVSPHTLHNYMNCPPEEPQLIIHKNAIGYDQNVVFGNDDKMGLLRMLGCQGRANNYTFTGDKCEVAGHVLHLSYSEQATEDDVKLRKALRLESLKNIVTFTDRMYVEIGFY